MRAPKVVILVFASVVAGVVAACAGVAPRPAERALPAWDAMSPSQKHAYMVETVMPEMQAIFLAYDRHRYAKMTCATCHGDEQGFAMPSRDLLLEPEIAARAPRTKMESFMRERVTPAMARLLGRPPLDAKTNAGFGCFGCHTRDD